MCSFAKNFKTKVMKVLVVKFKIGKIFIGLQFLAFVISCSNSQSVVEPNYLEETIWELNGLSDFKLLKN